jgi:hypothetical protein
MSKKIRSPAAPELAMVRRVTRRHGEAFAERWYEESNHTLAMTDAFTAAAVMTWPESADWDDPAQARYLDIEDEILDQTFATARSAIAEAFVKVASAILARERHR